MDYKDILKMKLQVLTELEELQKREDVLKRKRKKENIVALMEPNKSQVFQQKAFLFEPAKKGQIKFKDLARLITNLLSEVPVMTHNQLVEELYNNYGLKWKNFFDTLTNLRRGNYLTLDKFKRNGITYYQLSEQQLPKN
jgi:hypothetical protein